MQLHAQTNRGEQFQLLAARETIGPTILTERKSPKLLVGVSDAIDLSDPAVLGYLPALVGRLSSVSRLEN